MSDRESLKALRRSWWRRQKYGREAGELNDEAVDRANQKV